MNGLVDALNNVLDPNNHPTLFNGVLDFFGETPRGEDILDNVTLYEDQNRLIVTLYNNLSYIITNTMNETTMRIDLTTVHGNTSYEGYFVNSGNVVVPTLSTSDFIPIENVFGLVNAAKNMAIKYSYFHIKGTFVVDAKLIKKNVPLDIYVRKVGRSVEMKIILSPLPGIGILMDDGNDKTDTIYYKDGDLYLVRQGKNDTKLIRTTLSSFGAQPTYYLKFLTTFKQFIIDAIDDSIENKMKKRGPLSLNKAITGFNASDDGNTIDVTLDMAVITNDSSFTSTQFTINLGQDETGDTILANASFGLNLFKILDLKTSDLKLYDYSEEDKELEGLADFVNKFNGVDYDTEYTISGDEATDPQVNSLIKTYTISFNSQGGENVQSITKTANSPITLPKPNKESIDDGKEKLTYEFVGWFTQENIQFTSDKMPKQNLTLYAKWKVTSEVYEGVNSHRIEIFYKDNLVYTNNHAEGSVIDMKSLFNGISEQTHYFYDNAFAHEITENIEGTMLTITNDITIYIRGKYVLTLSSEFGNFSSQTFEIWEGDKIEIDVPSIENYQTDNTKYEFKGFEIPDVMPAENTTITANWDFEYKITFNYAWYKSDKFGTLSGDGTPKQTLSDKEVWVKANGVINDFTQYYVETFNVDHTEGFFQTKHYVFKCESFSTDASGGGTIYEATSIYKVTGPATLHAVWTYVSGPN